MLSMLAMLYSYCLLAGTPGGDAYAFSEFQQMLAESGFRNCELHPLPPTFFSVVMGTKHHFWEYAPPTWVLSHRAATLSLA
jgi:hypothetical protein